MSAYLKCDAMYQPVDFIMPSLLNINEEIKNQSLKIFFSSSPVISNQSTRYSTSWCAGCLSWWGPLQRGDLARGFNHCWL